MSENKTQATGLDASSWILDVEPKGRREDAQLLLEKFQNWTGMSPVLWANGLAGKPGSAIIGFGHYHYKYASGREGDWFLTGFSPRKANMAVYIMPGFSDAREMLGRLGPHKHSVSCLYLGRLSGIDIEILEEIVRDSIQTMKMRYDWEAS